MTAFSHSWTLLYSLGLLAEVFQIGEFREVGDSCGISDGEPHCGVTVGNPHAHGDAGCGVVWHSQGGSVLEGDVQVRLGDSVSNATEYSSSRVLAWLLLGWLGGGGWTETKELVRWASE